MHKALGRGLEALIPTATIEPKQKFAQEMEIAIDKIIPNKNQPRKYFDEERIKELASSIKKHGLAQPLVVKTSLISGEFELIAGERRLRAAKIAGLDKIPVVIRNVDENLRIELSLVENLQREDLNPIEQAQAFQEMMERFNLTQEEIAEKLSLSRSKIANILRLLSLSEDIKDLILQGLIPAGQARALIAIDDEQARRELAERIIRERLTTREVEKIASDWKQAVTTHRVIPVKRKNAEVRNIEETLQRALGTKVQITTKRKGGSVKIDYYSLDDLDRIIDLLTGHKKKK